MYAEAPIFCDLAQKLHTITSGTLYSLEVNHKKEED